MTRDACVAKFEAREVDLAIVKPGMTLVESQKAKRVYA